MSGSAVSRERLAGLRIRSVAPGSPADRCGLLPADVIRAVNGATCPDAYDFVFRTADQVSSLTVERGGAQFDVMLDTTSGESAGLEFADLLGDGVHICNNRCVFCFIHQMPRGMRRSLYLRDDDFRLSFAHGNYITLTNLSGQELQRIAEQRLSPLYVSVHATDPHVRGWMLGRKDPVDILDRLEWLRDVGVDTHAQVVLCPRMNDGSVLDRTVSDLARLHPASSRKRHGVLSVAIVPVGLTRYRDRLPNLETPDRPMARRMITWGRNQARHWHSALGTRFVWLSDEWYFLAGHRIPSRVHYEGFPQLEDGVGTTRLFLDELSRIRRLLPDRVKNPCRAVLITGELASDVVGRLATALNRIVGVQVQVLAVRNTWFGGTISATGLLTGQDIAAALRLCGGSEPVFLPSICLGAGRDRFLDDMSVEELQVTSGRRITVVEPRPRSLTDALGLTPPRRMG